MRQAVPAALPLFRSEMQLRLLGLLLLDSDREWTVDALQRALGAPRPSVHREIQRALGAGIVSRDASARPHRYRGVSEGPIAEPLRELLRLTVGLETELRIFLRGRADVQRALIHGSWASGRLSPSSDVDLIVIGDTGYDELARTLMRIGKKAGRRIDLTLFTPSEFDRHVRGASGFLQKLLEDPVIPLVGSWPPEEQP